VRQVTQPAEPGGVHLRAARGEHRRRGQRRARAQRVRSGAQPCGGGVVIGRAGGRAAGGGGGGGGGAAGGAQRVTEAEHDDAVGDGQKRLGGAVQVVGVRQRDPVQSAGADGGGDGAEDEGEQEGEAEGDAGRRGHRRVLEPVQHRQPREE